MFYLQKEGYMTEGVLAHAQNGGATALTAFVGSRIFTTVAFTTITKVSSIAGVIGLISSPIFYELFGQFKEQPYLWLTQPFIVTGSSALLVKALGLGQLSYVGAFWLAAGSVIPLAMYAATKIALNE